MTKAISVIGGGVIGLSCAIRLADAGHAVTVFDPGHRGEAASWGNAGHIATEQARPMASIATIRSLPRQIFTRGGPAAFPPGQIAQWLPFGLRLLASSGPRRFAAGQRALGALMMDAMPAWLRLASDIGRADLLREDGHFVVWQNDAAAREGKAAWDQATPRSATLRWATEEEAIRLRRAGVDFGGAIRFDGTGAIADLAALNAALVAALRARGGTIVPRRVTLGPDGRPAHAEGPAPDLVIVCAGIGSRALLRPAGIRVPLVAERGYHIRAEPGDWPVDLPPVVFEDRSIIVTRYTDCVQVAGFVEFGRADAAPDPRKWERLERHVAALGLPFGPPFRRWMGCRPTLPDYLPAIGQSHWYPHLLYAFGHNHLGLTLAATTGERIAALADMGTPSGEDAPFSLQRFALKGQPA